MSEPVYLSPQLFVAEGNDRKCYRHPTAADRCIKLLHPEVRPARFRSELRYYRRLERRAVDFSHLTRYRGMIGTSLGNGAVFDMVLDDDDRISRHLVDYLAQQDPDVNRWVIAEIERLQQYLYEQWIVCHDLHPSNILVKRLSYDEYRLVVINGIGDDNFIPLASYSPACARRKLVHLWNRDYRDWYASFPAVQRALKPFPAG